MNHFKRVIKAVPIGLGTLLLGQLAWTQTKIADVPVHAIIDVERGYLLGGTQQGKWVQPTVAAKTLSGQEKYRVYGLKGLVGDSVGGKPASDGPPCEDTLFSHLKPISKVVPFDNHMIGIAGGWNPQPRRLQFLNPSNAIYRRVVRDVLKQNGLPNAPVEITQIMRVDLDGNGEPAILISTKHYTSPEAPPGGISFKTPAGGYSFVLLRRMVGGKLQTQLLESEFHKTAGQAPYFFQILNVLDLNGDGKMEVLTRGQYYEGDYTSVYSEMNGQFKEVLSSACGA